jgi:hypothetical protein
MCNISWNSADWQYNFVYVCKWIYTFSFHICWPIWVKFGTECLHTISCVSYEFREIRWNESRGLFNPLKTKRICFI